jgi:hypothetical protein
MQHHELHNIGAPWIPQIALRATYLSARTATYNYLLPLLFGEIFQLQASSKT